MQTVFSVPTSKPQCQTVLLLHLCSHSNATSSLQWRWVDNKWIMSCETPQTQLNKFLIEMHEPGQHPHALHYWHECRATYECLADTVLDLLAAPASQAYIECVFSVCGLLTQGHHKRMTKSLEMKARLKLNAKVFAWTDYNNNVDCRNKAYCDV